jgi:hypothetical protein
MQDNAYQPPYEASVRQHFRTRLLPAAIYLLAAAALIVIVKGIGI